MPAASDDPETEVTRENSAATPLDYEQFFRVHRPKLVQFARRAADNAQQGEDAVQEAMIDAYGQWPEVSVMANTWGWVVKVTSRKIYRLRKSRETPVPVEDTAVPLASEKPAEESDLWDAVRELPPRQREIVAMRYQLDLSIGEIAARLDIKEPTVRSNLSRAKRRLEALLTTIQGEGER